MNNPISRTRKFLLLYLTMLFSLHLPAQGTWSQQASYGGDERAFGFAFVVNGKAYVGGGESYGGSRNDEEMWAYDPAGNVWARKADLPLVPYRAEAMAVGSYGYLIAAVNRSGNWVTEVWQYNPASDQWLQKSNFPGAMRVDGVAIAIGNKGYYGLGSAAAPYKRDFWEYDLAADRWTQQRDCPVGRRAATAFAIGSKGYIGLGDTSGLLNDCWEYDPAADSWTARAAFGGAARRSAVGFCIHGKGYVGTGFDGSSYRKDFWEYNPAGNSWQQVSELPGAGRQAAAAFAINNQGYVVNGYYSTLSVTGLKDLWQYTASTQHIASTAPGGSVTVFPNPGDGRFRIAGGPAGILSLRVYDLTGKMLLEQQDLQPGQALPDLSGFGKSVYTLEIRSSAGVARVKLVME